MRKIFLTVICLFIIPLYANAFPPYKIAPGKYAKIFYDAQFGFTSRNEGSGASGDASTSEFNFRRNRLGIIGTYNKYLSFYAQTEYIEDTQVGPLHTNISDNNQNFYLIDAQVRLKLSNALHIRIGKFKHNLDRENLEACFKPLTWDRSVFVYAPFHTSRDKGVAVWGNLWGNKLQYRLAVMDGKTSGDPSPESNFRYGARIHLTLLDPENHYGYAGTYLGKKKVLTIGASYQYEPNVVYADVKDRKGAKNYHAYSFDVFFEYPFENFGVVTLSSAYLNVDFDDAYKGADPDRGSIGLNGQKNGYYVKAGYMYPEKIGPGKLQIFGRFDNFRLAKYDKFYDEDIKWYGVGLNYYVHGENLKFTIQYSTADFDKEDPNNPDVQNFDTIRAFIQVRL